MQVRAPRSGEPGYLPVCGGEVPNDSVILHSKRLGQECVPGAYLKVEAGELNFLRFNQPKLRAYLGSSLEDAVRAG